MELAYELIYGIVRENIGEKGKKYFPFIFALFMMIVILNLFGLVPYTFSPTAHIAVTFGLSLSIFLGVTLLGMVNYGANYFSMFMPAGSPLALAPFMIIIEIVSHMAKAISLGVRLAANITAGHILFAILSGFV
ncbi:MAG: ATP synthase F0 subunit A [Rhodobacteraceae bacterium]|nr:ATP synthase F0 subunit A [Paracoccaceae bacterium]